MAKGALPSTITIDAAFVRDPPGVAGPAPKLLDFLDAYQRSGGQWPYQLQVINKTERFVDAYLLGMKEEKRSEHLWGRLEPGQTSQFPAGALQLWQFRSPLTGEIIGMIKTRPIQSDSYTLTDEFCQGWLKYQNEISSERFSPLRIIGERRSSTPSRDDQAFITATTVRRDLSKDVFNGLKNRVLRDVEIAGVLLRWSGANQLLSDYYGEEVADIRSLTIYADRMEVSDHLRFPRANVTIHARELAFTGIGCIDTTPLTYPARAESDYLTNDPLDPTNTNAPADAEGNPTYVAKDGAKGEPGGNITLYVRRLFDEPGNTSTKRLICHGGKGQAGEAGGLKAYVAKDGYPAQYGPLPPITANDVRDFFQNNNCGRDPCWRYRWPGGVDWPDQMKADHPAGNVLNTGHAAAVTLLTYCDDMGPSIATPIAWGERGFLPGHQYDHWYNPKGAFGDHSEDTTPNPAPRPCDGRDAYPGGWPGDGGDGGVITATLGSAHVPDVICDVGPGLPGDYTAYTAGGAAPGPTPAYTMRIVIVKHSLIESSRGPHVELTEVSGKPGQNASGRAYHGATVPSAPNGLQYDWRDTTAKNGSVSQKNAQGDDLSWAQFAAARAVLSYARTAYRNGFREEATAALDPYFALLGDKIASMSTDMQNAFASIKAMGNNLGRNLDYYGNPPGWVPRLNALSNLQILQSVREAAYGTYYFADKMLSDYEELDDARKVAQRSSDVLKQELDQARTTLQSAYEKLPEAMRHLDAVQQEIVPVQDEIEDLRKCAFDKTNSNIVAQRVFSAGMQILGGIAKSLPVGQPFVGLAGSALGSLSQFDWNAPDPLSSARSSISDFSTQVTNFVNTNQTSVATAMTSGLSGTNTHQQALVTKLTRQLEDEEKEPKDKAEAAEKTWTEFKNTERDHLQQQIKDTTNAIAEIQAAKNDQEERAANSFLEALNKQKAAFDEKKLATLRKGLVEYRKQQSDLEEQARKLARAENEKLKAAAAKTSSSDIPPSVQTQLTEATRVSEDQQKRITDRQTTANTVMSSLTGLGDGLGEIGNGIISLATPLSEDDPTWNRLAEQMLLDDPELRAKGMALNQKLREILGRKKQAASELFFWQQQASTCAATIASNMGALTQLSRQRQSLDLGLDSAVQGYLQETKERAKDALAQSIYWFVKSFQYENLKDVEDTFYNFDSWTDKLRNQEKAKQPDPAGSSQTTGRDPNFVLAEDEYTKVGDAVFKAEQLNMGTDLLQERQKHNTSWAGDYGSCVLERSKSPDNAQQIRVNQMLDNLLNGLVAFNFIDDFEKGSYAFNDARVVDIDLKEFDIYSTDQNLSFTIQIKHSGESIIGKDAGSEGRVFYAFQSGREDDPVSWEFVYNSSLDDGKKISKSSKDNTIDAEVKSLIDNSLNIDSFKEYNPGLFSSYMIHISDLDDSKKRQLKAVNKVVLDVRISHN
jgi:hypothetical protein